MVFGSTSRATWLACLFSLLSALTGIGCAQQENVILLEVISPEDVDDLTITVIPLDGMGSPSSAPRPVNQTADEIRETPLHVAIRLESPRDVMVVLSAPGPTPDVTLVAQRCFVVSGVVRDSVWLAPSAIASRVAPPRPARVPPRTA